MKLAFRIGAIIALVSLVVPPAFASPDPGSLRPPQPFGPETLGAFAKTVVHEELLVSGEPSPRLREALLQADLQERRRTGLYKIVGGVALSGLGVLLAANSSRSATVRDDTFGFEVTASERSTGKLVGGIGLAGAGVWLILSGSKDRKGE